MICQELGLPISEYRHQALQVDRLPRDGFSIADPPDGDELRVSRSAFGDGSDAGMTSRGHSDGTAVNDVQEGRL